MTGTPNRAAKPRKRAKRHTETADFDAFARRILRAYARRVAAGDVEALASMVTLTAEVDAMVRLAVAGLRAAPYSYSWDEIARRLGTTRQAAQQRYGDKSDRHPLDPRLLQAGLGVTVATLVQVFADHYPGSPMPSRCPGCGYPYPDNVSDCPTNATVRPLLKQRRGEDRDAVALLSPDQFADLLKPKSRTTRATVRQSATYAPDPNRPALPLFGLYGEDPTR
jgi:hypothetical protein